ncbi:hypothetical protein [Bacillus horti]|uniref:Formaldehyde-activating enzyme involved in methanogenesis n=1 Tax=Caldalkalibacillus horti TaxID=77523 RepID=A0ABT9W031_9BACI|nr:hypothetical protein [Bacillus horti]MDQ0166593.1 formaldehyde-activating enzyme involved in methanogenesis [Bacillus horti]
MMMGTGFTGFEMTITGVATAMGARNGSMTSPYTILNSPSHGHSLLCNWRKC